MSKALLFFWYTSPLNQYNALVDDAIMVVCRCAVPIFFVFSGFLFFETDVSPIKLKCYIVRILKLYITYSIINCFAMWIANGQGTTLKKIGVLIFPGAQDYLWYLYEVVVAVAFVFFLKKHCKFELLILLIGLLLFAVGLMGNTYYYFIQDHSFCIDCLISILGNTRNGLFFGTLFVEIGSLLRKYEATIYNQKVVLMCLMIFGGILLLGGEAICLNRLSSNINGRDGFLSLVLVVPLICIFVIWCEQTQTKKNGGGG